MPLVVSGVSWFQNKNAFHKEGSGYTPQPGDIVFFGPNGGSHTGIVVKSDANNVYTIEGNTSDRVAERTRPRATGYVYGYGTTSIINKKGIKRCLDKLNLTKKKN